MFKHTIYATSQLNEFSGSFELFSGFVCLLALVLALFQT